MTRQTRRIAPWQTLKTLRPTFLVPLVLLLAMAYLKAAAQGPTDSVVQRLVTAFESKDTFALAKAVRNAKEQGDNAAIPYLRRIHNSRLGEHPDVLSETEIALAKLGEPEALQDFICRVQSNHPLVKWNATTRLHQTGGWFSIRLLMQQFDADQEWARFAGKYKDDVGPDIIFPPPSALALTELTRVAPQAPIPPITPLERQARIGITERIEAWKHWIDANRQTLSTLEPGGLNLDFLGKTCESKEYRKKAKEWRKRAVRGR